MTAETIIYCPKCQGRNIKQAPVNPPAPRMVSMDELAMYTPAQFEPLVLHTQTWRATCQDCGYFVTYEGP